MNRPLFAVTAAVVTATFTPLAGAGGSHDHVGAGTRAPESGFASVHARALRQLVVVSVAVSSPSAGGTSVGRSSGARGDRMTRQVAGSDAQAQAAAAGLRRERDVTREATAARQLKRRARAEFASSLRAQQEGSLLQSIGVHAHPPLATQQLQITPRPSCDGRLATIVGTNGPDVITGTAGRDVIAGLGGDDQIYGLGQDDVICGGPGDDVIWGGAGNDRSFGGDGHDLIDAGPGNDTSDGGPGDRDGATFWDASGPITASLVTGTATGEGSDTFTNMEELHGGSFDDTLTGNAGNNTLFGLDGNDVLNGGEGNDTLSGGEGNDVIDGGAGQNDLVWFYAAIGPISASLATGTSSGQGNDTFTNVESLSGGDYGDTLIGDSGDNFLWGNGGDDSLSGEAGNDYLDGGNDADSLSGGAGDDFMLGGPGDDTMDGGPGDFDAVAYFDASGPVAASLASGTATGDGSDTFTNVEQLQGGPYGDTLSGGPGDDGIWGGAGNDTLYGGAGNDFLVGGAGDDTMDGGGQPFDAVAFFDETGPVTASLVTGTATGEGNDTFTNVSGLHGGGFADTFYGDAADNELFGNDGNDTLSAGAGNDVLNGGNGDDSLSGEAGNDYLDGADGFDLLDGGPDFDFCVNGETVINCEAP